MRGFLDEPPPPPPPPRDLLIDEENIASGENMEDWKRFREAGLLDVDSLQRRDGEAMKERIQRLERELYDYQHNMGLLLIEKKEWTSKCEQLQKSLSEEHEILKREKVANLFAFAQAEERASNLRQVRDAERQAATELERSLREAHLELEKITKESVIKLAEAKHLEAVIQEKSLEVQKKSLEAEEKLSEANKMIKELERKSEEAESTENVLKRERMSLNSERRAHEEKFLKHKDDIQKLETRLQEAEERLCQTRRDINERDEKIMEFDGKLKEKNLELEQKQNELQQLNLELKKKETEVFDRLADLSAKEEKAECARIQLEIKEKQLAALGERLNAREHVELQILLQGHRTALHVKEQEFELANEEKRKLLLEEHQSKLDALNRKLAELNHVEEKLKIREESLEKKSERAKEKEKEVQSMSRGLNSRKKTLNLEDKNLDLLRKEVDSEKANLQSLNGRLENIKAEISQQQMRVDDETAKLRMADDERMQHNRLLVGLKQEIESYRSHNDSLAIEIRDIKEDIEKFQEEWNALDEKRDELAKSIQQLQEKTDLVENLKATEKQLNKNKAACKEQISRELEYVRLSKESFEASMENDRSAFSKHADTEHAQLLEEFENYKRQLEADMLEKEEEIVKSILEKEAAFEANIERENNNFIHLKEALQRESKVVSVEKKRLEQDKQTTAMEKLQIEASRSKMLKDVNELVSLSRKLKKHRTEFIRERQKLALFTESLRNCQHCGATTRDYVLSSQENSQEVDDELATGEEILEKFASYVEVNDKTSAANRSGSSGGRISWLLQKCTPKIFSSRNGSQGIVAFPDVVIDSQDHRDLREHRYEKKSEKLMADKTVVEDGKAFVRMTNSKQDKVDPSSSSRAATALRVPKKRKFPIDGGSDDDDARIEAASESAPTVGRRKKQQKVIIPQSESTEGKQPRYNLRRRNLRGTCAAPLENGTTETDTNQFPESSNHTNQYTDAGKPTDENQKENSFSGSFQDMEYEEEDEEEASIQKKLWKFFTS